MKYSRMLFLPKNDRLIVNILSVIKHSVKNKENVKFPGHCKKGNNRDIFFRLTFLWVISISTTFLVKH